MQELQSIIINETDEDRLTSLILRAAPHLRRKRIKRMIKELREAGSTVYPSPYTKTSVPKVTAHRLFEDVFFPANTADIQRARAVFVREWLTEAELQERVVSHGYSQAYVDEVLGHEKETGFPMYTNDQIDGSWGTERVVGPSSHEYRGLYEQITAYHKSVNDDGVPGIYYTCFHHAVDFFVCQT